ncbi:MAG: hypothetical protein II858_06285 [Bacteroidales bacterium]|nr:hypothetical protein [Bacteroidales bacterium]
MNNIKITILTIVFLMATVPALQAQEKKPINKKNLVIKEWNTDMKTNAKVLDHVTTFNADGRKIEEIEYSGSSQKWRKRWEYDAAGRQTRELIYDERNRLVNIKKSEFNEFGRKKVTYTYNAKGKLITTKQYEYIMEEE